MSLNKPNDTHHARSVGIHYQNCTLYKGTENLRHRMVLNLPAVQVIKHTIPLRQNTPFSFQAHY